ncbi:MAG: hypothetical protein P8Y98_15550 [Anaerolineales bacterium]|jgi:hypothetical protein
MVEYNGREIHCADCPIHKRAEAKPSALLARFWPWHTTWCSGWKTYQEYLAAQGGNPEG